MGSNNFLSTVSNRKIVNDLSHVPVPWHFYIYSLSCWLLVCYLMPFSKGFNVRRWLYCSLRNTWKVFSVLLILLFWVHSKCSNGYLSIATTLIHLFLSVTFSHLVGSKGELNKIILGNKSGWAFHNLLLLGIVINCRSHQGPGYGFNWPPLLGAIWVLKGLSISSPQWLLLAQPSLCLDLPLVG